MGIAQLATSSRLWRPSTPARRGRARPPRRVNCERREWGNGETAKRHSLHRSPEGPFFTWGGRGGGRGIADFGLQIADLKANGNEGGGNDCGPPPPPARRGYGGTRRRGKQGEKQDGGPGERTRKPEPGNRKKGAKEGGGNACGWNNEGRRDEVILRSRRAGTQDRLRDAGGFCVASAVPRSTFRVLSSSVSPEFPEFPPRISFSPVPFPPGMIGLC